MEIIARGQITIWNYKDGDDAYSVILNHDTHAVACDPSGNALGGELGPSGKAVFALSAYRGATKLTMRYSSAASTAGMCAWKFGTISGCTAVQVSGSNEKFYVNTMTADSAYVEIVCSVDGKASITKRVTVVKQKKGDTGDPGKPGDDGKQGCMLRPRGTWTAQTQYVYNDQYRDVVIHNNSVYIVKTTHTSTVSFDSSKWEPFNEFINVATSVLLANKGYIDVLGAARLFVGDTNKSTGWEMTNGYIKHTKSGLTLTADGKLYDPDGLHLSVGGKTVQVIVDGAVDGIQVGGRNLLLNSDFSRGTTRWGFIGNTYTTTILEEGGIRISYKSGTASWGYINQVIGEVKINTDYVFTIKARADRNRNIKFSLRRSSDGAMGYAKNIPLTNEFKIISVNITTGSDSSYKIPTILLQDSTPTVNDWVEIEWVKFEQGNKATDWSPAPEDLTTKIEENSSKIEQLPNQISLTVKKEITEGELNYISNTTKILEVVGEGRANQAVSGGWIINKSISGKKYGGAFKVKFEGCSFASNSTIVLMAGNSAGWSYQGLTGYNKVSENKEYVFFRNTNTAPETTGDGGAYIRIDYVSGGKITISEVRAYAVPDSGLTEPLPWYPSKWENESIYSEIKQTADSISLKVAGWQGGTNLLPRSKFSESVKGWNVNGSPTYGITTFGGEKCLYLSGSVSGAGIWQKDYMPIQYKVKGCQFTVSFDVYNKFNAKSIRIGLEGSLSSELSVNILNIGVSGWTRVAKTITYNNIATDSFIIYTDYDNYPTVCVKNVKIEFGPYATNFTENEKDVLLSTGIDIFNKKLVLTADNTLIQSNDGQQIAMFTVKNGKPLLKAENIDIENLSVKKLSAFNETTKTSVNINGPFATISMSQRSSIDEYSRLEMEMVKEDLSSAGGYRQYPNIRLKGVYSKYPTTNVSDHNINLYGARFTKYRHTYPSAKHMAHCGSDYIALGSYTKDSPPESFIKISPYSIEVKKNNIRAFAPTDSVDIGGIKLFFINGIYVGKGQDWSDVHNEFLTEDPFINEDNNI